MKKLIAILFLILSVGVLAEIVYITPTGKKYHPIERAEAEARGYTPCKKGYK